MSIVKRVSRCVALILAALALAAPASAAPAHCSPQDYAMQCHYQASQLLGISPLASPTVIAQGVDAAWSKPTVAWMQRAGATFLAGYYSTDPSKNLTGGWVRAYQAAGFRTLGVWETLANRALSGAAGGLQDATQALAQANAAGEPSDRPIFFAVDFDETPAQGSTVAAYFRGVASRLPVARIGAYGGFYTIKRLFDAGLIRYGWQTSAWSGGQWEPRAQLQQYAYGATLDWDRAVAVDYGQWPYSPPRPKPVPARVRWASAQIQCPSLTVRPPVAETGGHWTTGAGCRIASMPFDSKPLGAG